MSRGPRRTAVPQNGGPDPGHDIVVEDFAELADKLAT
jgi:hypothetical protein